MFKKVLLATVILLSVLWGGTPPSGANVGDIIRDQICSIAEGGGFGPDFECDVTVTNETSGGARAGFIFKNGRLYHCFTFANSGAEWVCFEVSPKNPEGSRRGSSIGLTWSAPDCASAAIPCVPTGYEVSGTVTTTTGTTTVLPTSTLHPTVREFYYSGVAAHPNKTIDLKVRTLYGNGMPASAPTSPNHPSRGAWCWFPGATNAVWCYVDSIGPRPGGGDWGIVTTPDGKEWACYESSPGSGYYDCEEIGSSGSTNPPPLSTKADGKRVGYVPGYWIYSAYGADRSGWWCNETGANTSNFTCKRMFAQNIEGYHDGYSTGTGNDLTVSWRAPDCVNMTHPCPIVSYAAEWQSEFYDPTHSSPENSTYKGWSGWLAPSVFTHTFDLRSNQSYEPHVIVKYDITATGHSAQQKRDCPGTTVYIG